MSNLTARALISQVIEATGFDQLLGGRNAAATGLHQLELELMRIAGDAYTAEVRGTDLADAIRDFDNYSALARFHAGLEDILALSLPPEFVGWVKRLFQLSELPHFDDLASLLTATALGDESPIRRALCRVLLYEGILLQLRLRHSRADLVALGGEPEDLLVAAGQEVEVWMAAKPRLPADVRPLVLMVEGAAKFVELHMGLLKDTFSRMSQEVAETLECRAELERRLEGAEASDAILIRNFFARREGDQHATVDLLKARHPLVLGEAKRNTLDKRVERLAEHIKSTGGYVPERSGVALLDLIREQRVTRRMP